MLMSMNQNRLFKILGFLVFYLTISPISCYTSSLLEVIAYMLFIFLLIYNSAVLFDCNTKQDRRRTILLFIIAFVFPALIHVQLPFVTDLLQWCVILLVISLKNEHREHILAISIKLVSCLLLCSLFEYIIGYITGKSFTLVSTYSLGGMYTQSIFNIYRCEDLRYRFTALCDEPGALGALCGFIIAYLPMSKKNLYPLVICLVSGILSLSLAFFVYLLFILIYKTFVHELKLVYIIVIGVIIVFMSTIFREEIQTQIFMRVAETERLDNRSSDEVNKFVENIFNSTNALYGVGNKTAYALQVDNEHGNAGFKWKLYQYGIIGCGAYLWAMLLLYRKHRNRNVTFGFGILFFIMYFYTIGMWGVPLYMLLLFTTLSDSGENRIRIAKK